MADVYLTRGEAERAGRLPPVCMQCGAPAVTTETKTFSDFNDPPPADPVGCLFLLLWFPVDYLFLFLARALRTERTVAAPLCERHSRVWFSGTSFQLKSVVDGGLWLTGVSGRFAQALEEHRAATGFDPHAPAETTALPQIQIRCRSCRALNDETARFCNWCGAAL